MTMQSDSNASEYTDPNKTPPIGQAVPLGIQHILAMFASNITPPIIVAGAAGYIFGGAEMVYMIQMAMVFAGIATLMQTIGFGPVGARLPIVQGTSFAFIPIMVPIAKVSGIAAVLGGVVVGGIFHFLLGSFIGKLRRFLPPLVTGVVVVSIGLALLPIGIKYAAGGVPLEGKPEFGAFEHWGLALVVILVTFGIKFFARGFATSAAALLGLVAGYIVGLFTGAVNFGRVGSASWFELPTPLHFGIEFTVAAVIGMCLMSVVSAVETVGDISGITKGGAGREATDKEISGGTMADGLGTALAGIFGGLPNTSFSQNVGLVAMTGVMSRHVVTIGAIFLICGGLIPKFGAVIASMPIAVLGGGVIVMFGMVVSAGLNMLGDVKMNRRNMMIIALSLSLGLGLQAVPDSLQHLNDTVKLLLSTGLLPAAFLAILLNILLPEEDQQTSAA